MISFDLANTVDPKGKIYLDLLSLPKSVTGFISGLNMGLNFSMLDLFISLCGRMLFVFLQNRRFQNTLTTYH